MEDRYKVAVLVVISILAVSMISVAAVLYVQYHKVSEYACYYGLPEGYDNSNTMTANRPAGMQGSGNNIVNLLDLKCILMPQNGFECSEIHPPGIQYTSSEFRGNFWATKSDLEGFLKVPPACSKAPLGTTCSVT